MPVNRSHRLLAALVVVLVPAGLVALALGALEVGVAAVLLVQAALAVLVLTPGHRAAASPTTDGSPRADTGPGTDLRQEVRDLAAVVEAASRRSTLESLAVQKLIQGDAERP